jgi:hypothetical protein
VAAQTYPLLLIGRALVPGTRMVLPVRGFLPHEGDQVLVVLRGNEPMEDAWPARVGTVALVEGVRPLDSRIALVTLSGLHLAAVGSLEKVGEAILATASGVEGHGAGGDCRELIGRAQSLLRRQMAIRAEAGEVADISLQLSPDPVSASHQVASQLRVTWPEIQEVLEAGDAAERLRRSLAVMERETGLLVRLLSREGA